jgi:hypothetical protein
MKFDNNLLINHWIKPNLFGFMVYFFFEMVTKNVKELPRKTEWEWEREKHEFISGENLVNWNSISSILFKRK